MTVFWISFLHFKGFASSFLVKCPEAQLSTLAPVVQTLTTSMFHPLVFFCFFLSSSNSLGIFCCCPSSVCLSISGCALTAMKRLPFMRNRSKDKDKAKAIYRRSMCKTSDSRHVSLSLIILGETKKEKSLMSGLMSALHHFYSTVYYLVLLSDIYFRCLH